MLDLITITGADDSIKPEELGILSKSYPHTEWGLLLSSSQMGTSRFPSLQWLRRLVPVAIEHDLQLSAHLCGKWVREVCAGDWNWLQLFEKAGINPKVFNRVQLNFHTYTHLLTGGFIEQAKTAAQGYDFQTIFQCDGVNDHLVSSAHDDGLDAVPLYDRSGGAGVLPDKWPGSMTGIYSGYAGGLGPDNLEAELLRIAEAARGRHWVDMETKVRSDDDALFDLDKVVTCLDICSRFMRWVEV